MNRFVLASVSPRRRELLKKILKSFKIIPSKIDEKAIKAKTPSETAVKTALAKALDVATKCNDSIVIGADTIVILKHKIIGKPKSKKDAFRILKSLSGTTHKVITGIAVVNSKNFKALVAYEETIVKMKKISDKEILDYVSTGSPMDKAGGYGIQEVEDPFIDKIDGDYDNVVGLPVNLLNKMINRLKKGGRSK